jgi:hypothetical protein
MLELQFRNGLDIVFVRDDTINRADGDAGRFVIRADALRTTVGIDDINRIPFFNCFGRALFSAGIAGDTLIVDQKGHTNLVLADAYAPGNYQGVIAEETFGEFEAEEVPAVPAVDIKKLNRGRRV